MLWYACLSICVCVSLSLNTGITNVRSSEQLVVRMEDFDLSVVTRGIAPQYVFGKKMSINYFETPP